MRSHTFQIQPIRKPIPQRSHTAINQPFSTYQNLSFHRATDQPDILSQISQSNYVSVFAVSFAFIYVFAISYASATDYASVNTPVYAPGNAFTNAPAYTFVYALTYAPAYAPAAAYASESAAASTRASKSEMTVSD